MRHAVAIPPQALCCCSVIGTLDLRKCSCTLLSAYNLHQRASFQQGCTGLMQQAAAAAMLFSELLLTDRMYCSTA